LEKNSLFYFFFSEKKTEILMEEINEENVKFQTDFFNTQSRKKFFKIKKRKIKNFFSKSFQKKFHKKEK